MKKTTLVFVMMISSLAWANDPATYTTTVHVAASHYSSEGRSSSLVLNTLIGGKKYELDCGHLINGHSLQVLAPGDYKAKLLQDLHPNAYEYAQIYELLFPDNNTQQCSVTGQTE